MTVDDRVVPASVRDALDSFDAGRTALAAGASAEGLTGGLTNRTWRVRAPGVDWVVRIGGGRDATLGIDRRAELVALAAAGAAGLAPALVHGDPARGLCVLRHRPGVTWTRAQARSIEGLRRVGERIRSLHALPIPAALPALDVAGAISHYLSLPPPSQSPVPRDVVAVRAAAALAAHEPGAPAFCHHDLHHLNVIDDGTLTFVDWEYAAAGDPWLDVAAWASYHDLDAGPRRALVEAYAATPGPAESPSLHRASARLDAACAVFDCLEALWYDAAGAWTRIDPAHRTALVARLGGGRP